MVLLMNFESEDSNPRALAGFERFDVTDNTQTSDPSSLSSETDQSFAFEAKKKLLHESIIVQQDQICQASRALLFCRQNELFRGKREEVNHEFLQHIYISYFYYFFKITYCVLSNKLCIIQPKCYIFIRNY